MTDTYRTLTEKNADGERQRELLKALDASSRALRLDECGAWRISGKRGGIYTWADRPGAGWVILCGCRSPRAWAHTKKRLSFCQVTQDGDEGGCLRLRELPTPEQAAVIRKAIGIAKRQPARAHLPVWMKSSSPNEGVSRRHIDETTTPAT
jgi:hypothetical protein